MIILSLSVAIRNGVGTDYESYIYVYREINHFQDIFSIHGDFLFNFLIFFIKKIGFNEPYFFFFMISFSSFILLEKITNQFKLQKHRLLILFLYFSFFFMNYHYNLVRHGLMVSLVWFAFSNIKKGKLKNFFILIIIAGLIHKLAFIFIFFYWILQIKLNKRYVILTFIGSAFIFIFGLFKQVLIPFLIRIIPFSSIKKVLNHYNSTYYLEDDIKGGVTVGVIVYSILFFFLFINRKKMENFYYFDVFLNSLFFAIVLFLAFNDIGVFSERITGLLYLSLIFLIPLLIKFYNTKQIKVLPFMIALVFGILLFNKNINKKEKDDTYQFMPYETIYK